MLLNHLQLSANYNVAIGKTGDFNVVDATTGVVTDAFKGDAKANSWQIAVTYFF